MAMGSLERFTPYVLSILRIVTALIFIEHGTQKLFGFPALPPSGSTVAIFSLYGAAALMEVILGPLVLVGLLTRPAAFLLSGEMAVAYWYSHAPRSVYPLLNGGDAAILFCFVFLFIAFAGPGPLSLDRLLRKVR